LSDGSKSDKILYIKEQVIKIKEKYDKLVFGDLSLNEFWKDLAPMLGNLTRQPYTDIIGEITSDDLRSSLAYISSHMEEYRKSVNIGDDDYSRILRAKLLNKMREVIDTLENLHSHKPPEPDTSGYIQDTQKDVSPKEPKSPNIGVKRPPRVTPVDRPQSIAPSRF
jgi:hypothetical protein